MLMLKDIKFQWKEGHFARYKCNSFIYLFILLSGLLGAWKAKKISLIYLNK